MNTWIPLQDCLDRQVYLLRSRNLNLGVYCVATQGFIGIRTKFESRYLDLEYHWDCGPPHGTARPIKVLPLLVPEEIELFTWRPGNNKNPGLFTWLDDLERVQGG